MWDVIVLIPDHCLSIYVDFCILFRIACRLTAEKESLTFGFLLAFLCLVCRFVLFPYLI